jgi:hypothetical protein
MAGKMPLGCSAGTEGGRMYIAPRSAFGIARKLDARFSTRAVTMATMARLFAHDFEPAIKLISVRHLAKVVIALATFVGCTMLPSVAAKADVVLTASSLDAGLGQTNSAPGPTSSPLSVTANAPGGGSAKADWNPDGRLKPIHLNVDAVGSFTNPDLGTIGNHGGAGITINDTLKVYQQVLSPVDLETFIRVPLSSAVTPMGPYTIKWDIYLDFPTPTQPGEGLTIVVGVNGQLYALNDTYTVLNFTCPPFPIPCFPPSLTTATPGGSVNFTNLSAPVNGSSNLFSIKTAGLSGADIDSLNLSFFAGITASATDNVEFSDPWMFTVYDINGNVVPDLSFDSQGGLQYNVTEGTNPTSTAVPEPTSIAIFSAALFSLGCLRRRHQRRVV